MTIVGFYLALRRSLPRAEVRVWTQESAPNLLSLAVTFVDFYWVRRVEGPNLRAIFGLYIFGNAWFVVHVTLPQTLGHANECGADPLARRSIATS